MCGRYSLDTPPEELIELFRLAEAPELPPRFNIAPTQLVPVVRALRGPGDRRLELMRWGLIPAWAKDPSIGSRMINARADTIADKPAFRFAFRRQRCIVPASGFYEWQKLPKSKRPFYLRRRDGRPLAFAGLWERWKDPEGERIESCTILTTDANTLVAPIHDRMPVILEPADFDLWLDPTVKEPGPLLPLLHPPGPEVLEAWTVRPLVNDPSNDDPRLIAPWTEGEG